MRFLHYSDKPVSEVCPKVQDGVDSRFAKPNGLWFSIVDENGHDSWKELCKVRNIKPGRYTTEIIIRPRTRICWLTDAAAIDKLHAEYGFQPKFWEYQKENLDYTRSAIRWACVAKQFDTIITTPYCIERHRPEHWYSTWECGSGCAWAPNTVDFRPSLLEIS
jgi:hypothetical protein